MIATAGAKLESAFVKEAARAAGFHLVGVARAGPLDPGPLDRVLREGAEAGMAWLRTQRAERLHPERLLPEVKSVVALGLGYAGGWREVGTGAGAGGGGGPPGRIARYARGRDYHLVTKAKLRRFVEALRARDPSLRAFPSCDVAPVMEKVWAERAGLGWVGKNGCLISEELGSWVLLSTVLVDRELEPDLPHPGRCGSCAACLPACPTGAIPEPGLVDARRCLSYQTIEHRGPFPEELAELLGPWGFGCDDCQTVCPWNRAVAARCDPELREREGQGALDLEALLAQGEPAYRQRYHGTALARARYDGLLRDALLAAGSAGLVHLRERARTHLASPLPGVRAAALWTALRLEPLAGAGGAPALETRPMTSLAERLAAARQGAAVAPVQPCGLLRLDGAKRLDLLHRLSTQSVKALLPGAVAHLAFLGVKGHLVADGLVLVAEDHAMLSVAPERAEPLLAHLGRYVMRDDVRFQDLSPALRAVVALGPGGVALARERAVASGPAAALFESPRRGAPALEVLLPSAEAEAFRQELLAAGALSLEEGDLEALRIAAGVPAAGAELDEKRLPMEAGLVETAVSFDKGCYLGQEVVLRGTFRGAVQRGLVQLELPPGAGAGTALLAGEEEVGVVTSAADLPEGRLGLGYLRRAHWNPGERLETAAGPAVVRRVLAHNAR